MSFTTIAIELAIGYLGLFIITKLLGKGTISQLTPFDFIAAILLGELVGSAVFDSDVKVHHLLFGLFIWFILIYCTEIISQKFKSTRKLLEGDPSIVIRQGKIQREALKKAKLDINQLQHLLRTKDSFSIREVEYAILETDGQLSVMKKSRFASPTVSDLKLPLNSVVLPITLIIDGEVLWDNLKVINKDPEWFEGELKAKSINSYKDVLFADYKPNEGLFIDRFEDTN
ncbi:DUF421 domain-containing protein [Litchfieldia alkalitelluris]|uniref:DUF421 domain-containing protein n=1 Tax=Litchfieldia alkalitelluris TaxID=304268 RepID=UPI0009986E2B|nr:DUF421 domain-containing protein [Litchfieldia alkalitelluris]